MFQGLIKSFIDSHEDETDAIEVTFEAADILDCQGNNIAVEDSERWKNFFSNRSLPEDGKIFGS